MVALVCFYSSYSLAYTQQYNVGDTGPNGGTVTSSTLTSVITNTEVTLNGGFEETTTTTNWTETVVEEIATSTIQSRVTAGVANGTYIFCLPGSSGACRTGWDRILATQLDIRNSPCNFAELLPRLTEK